ncbi:MAG: hypothetical protein A3B30_01220 [Candidatus Komeilibacteria bacterium RIFCSPLOWO2_01_FULL_52_15]|uniref:Ferric oxidoreductase domain-containing protein n=2 Tax=Candidatus Komeiliibacteriota TaxID=1817908 RepID=A0A1G2BPQ7_9BACT|nr:MAG: hypothetical protein A2677_00990 [Candidatus Komeilibacteria bacterium RIFCSPHIGHO2_01_FULL_52_14]OGY90796.1 MAG: hypothetical protein A3B30_01220 [Candidatus Komeilibacteria bacterium RIFCSPLOWO2_01_FULL_52_15]
MNKLPRICIIVFGYAAVLYPLWVRFNSLTWAPGSFLQNIFPMFGLAAFSILWLHSLSGVFEPWLRKHINFDRFVEQTAAVVLICIVAHPLLALISFDFNIGNLFAAYGVKYILIGVIGWILLITYDVGKILKRYDFFKKNWEMILTISTIGFLMIFFHALAIGSDLTSGPLRIVWIFYGVTAALATIYRYGIKMFIKNKTENHS